MYVGDAGALGGVTHADDLAKGRVFIRLNIEVHMRVGLRPLLEQSADFTESERSIVQAQVGRFFQDLNEERFVGFSDSTARVL